MEGCAATGQKLLCEACKVAPAKVFSAGERQVYCWRCDEAAHNGNTCARYLIVDSPLPAISQHNEGARHSGTETGPSTGCVANDVFASWPSDSEESLLVDFTQGLAPGFAGDSEFLDWFSGGSLIEPANRSADEKSEEYGGSHVEELTTGPSLSSIDGSFGFTMPLVDQSQPLMQNTEDLGESSPSPVNIPLGGSTRMSLTPPATGPLGQLVSKRLAPLPFGVDLVTQKLPGMVVPGVPYGMVPVTMPARYCRHHSLDGLEPLIDPRQHTRKRNRNARDQASLRPVLHARATSMPSQMEIAAARLRHHELGTTSCVTPQRRCTHCGASKTPQWRAGPHGQKTLCNACGVKYKAGRLGACGTPTGRGRRVGQLTAQRKAVMAADGRTA